jgi:hypothetical protein
VHGELLKLGIDASRSTVSKYMVRHRKPPSQTWRTFLENHVKQLVSVGFFVVPAVSFRILFVFLVLAHDRRRVLHFNVTEHPTAEWTATQIVQAFGGIQLQATCSATVTGSMVTPSVSRRPACRSAKSLRLLKPPGNPLRRTADRLHSSRMP